MTGYLLVRYRALSGRVDRRAVAAAPRTLRIAPLSSFTSGVFLAVPCRGALAWLAVTGRIAPAALSPLAVEGAAVFHTSLYAGDMQAYAGTTRT
ncbi:hypothetical protein GCM10010238_30900 [Streptomyces griseoviridis]|uniref:Uncharacterized protein n=1 Tax=Streptomyces griseoviridis TaxID=45398 RepID=A0A918GIQ0_STRGD|nr:hypothetical protein GCM10010238_30900 [Streptomyces niveoruber]